MEIRNHFKIRGVYRKTIRAGIKFEKIMKRFVKIFYFVSFTFILSSCIASKVLLLKSVSYSPTNPNDIKIYYKDDSIQFDYIKFAQITMKVPRNINTNKMNEKCKEKASELGATGVIFESRRDKGVNYFWLNRESTLDFIAIKKINSSNQVKEQDVVYLKNGSIIHGYIIERIPNESIKIKTSNGDIFVYEMAEIKKIEKVNSPK